MSLGLDAASVDVEEREKIAKVQVTVWSVALGVFIGMWMFAASVAVIYAVLHATGDIR